MTEVDLTRLAATSSAGPTGGGSIDMEAFSLILDLQRTSLVNQAVSDRIAALRGAVSEMRAWAGLLDETAEARRRLAELAARHDIRQDSAADLQVEIDMADRVAAALQAPPPPERLDDAGAGAGPPAGPAPLDFFASRNLPFATADEGSAEGGAAPARLSDAPDSGEAAPAEPADAALTRNLAAIEAYRARLAEARAAIEQLAGMAQGRGFGFDETTDVAGFTARLRSGLGELEHALQARAGELRAAAGRHDDAFQALSNLLKEMRAAAAGRDGGAVQPHLAIGLQHSWTIRPLPPLKAVGSDDGIAPEVRARDLLEQAEAILHRAVQALKDGVLFYERNGVDPDMSDIYVKDDALPQELRERALKDIAAWREALASDLAGRERS